MKRRDFLHRIGGIAAGTLAANSVWWPVTASALNAGGGGAGGRILVMVVLEGGNDGLNTVIPHTDPLYYSLRPNLAVPSNQVLGLQGGASLHPNLLPLMPLWNEGRMAVIRDVGYPDMNLSHFRATDILFSGSSSQEVIPTGWLGRWLESIYPSFPTVLPADPMALQQGLSAGLLLQGERGATGVVVNNPSSFYWLVTSNYNGPHNDQTAATEGGDELDFMRSIDRASFEYANAIETASGAGTNRVAYPAGNYFADQLSVVARLIDGGMNTPVYVASQNGYDTHASQLGAHPALLSELAGGLAAFVDDLKAMGRFQDVMILTVSEFGRRVGENGSDGTDHGTSAPWFAIGDGLRGGLYGGPPDLGSLDQNGNMATQVDYRSVYASILSGWFCSDATNVQTILNGSYPMLPFMSTVGVPEPGGRPVLALAVAGGNPAAGPRRIRFTLPAEGRVRLNVIDVSGRLVSRLVDGTRHAGAHDVVWDAAGVAPGLYWAALEAGGRRVTEKLVQR